MSPDDILKLLQTLATQLTPPAQHVWELAVRQTFIEGIEAAIGAVFFIIVLPIAWGLVARRLIPAYIQDKKDGRSYPESELPAVVWLIVGTFLLTVIIMIGGECLITAINNMLNPEWQTIIKLSHLVIASK